VSSGERRGRKGGREVGGDEQMRGRAMIDRCRRAGGDRGDSERGTRHSPIAYSLSPVVHNTSQLKLINSAPNPINLTSGNVTIDPIQTACRSTVPVDSTPIPVPISPMPMDPTPVNPVTVNPVCTVFTSTTVILCMCCVVEHGDNLINSLWI
jgi:hypothetical protein